MIQYFPKIHSRVNFNSINFTECTNSPYIKLQRMNYIENGKNKAWDMVLSHDSVAVLLYHCEDRAFLIVRQFRPAVYCNGNGDGYTYELCAGLVDKKGKSLEQIASEEVLEECGYEIMVDKLQKCGVFYNSTGISGSKQTIFFAQIEQKDKTSQGGGIDDECVEVLSLPIQKAKIFIEDNDVIKTPGLAYAIRWYLDTFKGQ